MAGHAGGGKNTVEGCRSIDALECHRRGYLRTPRWFSWAWTRDGERVASITVETQRRSVLQNVTQSWNQLIAARANIVSTDEQVRAAVIAAEGTHEEEQVGLRSTLDVLNAEQELRAAQLSQVTARHDEYAAAAAVLAAMGRLEARNLIPATPRYDPKSNFRRLRFTWGWTPWEEPIAILDRVVALPAIPQSHDLAREPAIGPGLQQPPPAAAPAPPVTPGAAPSAH